MGDSADSSWLPLPDSLDTSMFYNQFWALQNYFAPMIFPIIGLAIATVVLIALLKNAFKTGS